MKYLPELIYTPRTKLRPFEFDDVDDVFAYASDPAWSRYLLFVPQPYTRETARQFIAAQVLQDRVTHPSWAIEYESKVIGGINVRFHFDHRIAEMGYSLARSHWGQGFVTEVAQSVVDQAFLTYPQLHKVRAMADARNIGSLRVMEKVGMKREGVLRQDRYIQNGFMDEVWYGLLRIEWEAGRLQNA